MAVFFALIALVGWGTGDIFIAKLSRKIGGIEALYAWLIGCFILMSFYLPWAGPIADWKFYLIAIALNLMGIFTNIFYFKALESGNASLVGTISGSFPVVTVPLSILLFAEKLSSLQLIAIILVIIGLIFSSLNLAEIKKRNLGNLVKDKNIRYALLTCVLWGIYWTLIRIPIEKIGWFWASYCYFVAIILFPVLKLIKKNPVSYFSNKYTFLIIFAACLLTTLANFGFNIGLTYGYSSIVSPIAGASPVLFVIISRFVFHEKLTFPQKTGIIFTLMGIVLIGISSI